VCGLITRGHSDEQIFPTAAEQYTNMVTVPETWHISHRNLPYTFVCLFVGFIYLFIHFC